MIIHVSNSNDTAIKNAIVKPSVQEAYDCLKQEYEKGTLDPASEIIVHAGTYYIDKPICFDSDFPVTVRNFENDKVYICGGKQLTGWTKTKINGKKTFRLALPEDVTELPFLYVDGKLAEPARWPKKDYLRVTDEYTGLMSDDSNCDNFHINKGDFNPKWYDPENISIHMIHLWTEENLKLKSYDEKTNKLTLASCTVFIQNKGNTEYYYQNVREALSEPGEFYFDRNKHELLLITGKDDFEAVVPVCDTLVRFISGAKWVTLSGLNFKYGGSHWPRHQETLDLRDNGFAPVRNTNWKAGISQLCSKKTIMPLYASSQGATHVPGVILFQKADSCTVKDCTISACPWYGIQVLDGCRGLAFTGNEISDMGAGGILIGGGNASAVKDDPSMLTSRIIVRKNHIHDCGLFFHSGAGIMITHAFGCFVEKNHIHDLLYTGISCGLNWGYGETVTKENTICRNHIHDLGKGILSDMGGIYILGVQPGTRVYENVIHDIVNRYYGGWGLYADEGTSHVVFERNIVYDCACEGFHQNYGRENIVRFNIFAFNKIHGMAFTNNFMIGYSWPYEPHGKIINVYNNVILTDGTPAYFVGDEWALKTDRLYSDCNIFFDLTRKQKELTATPWGEKKSYTVKEWQDAGLDRRSIVADPGFRNVKKRDFHLKKDSILMEYGFYFLKDILDARDKSPDNGF